LHAFCSLLRVPLSKRKHFSFISTTHKPTEYFLYSSGKTKPHTHRNTPTTTTTTTMSLQSDAVFQKIIDGLKENEAKAKAVNGVFLYKITKDGKVAKEWSKYQLSIAQWSP